MSWISKILGKKEIGKIDNPFSQKVPDCTGRRLVISDIHGCLQTFMSLVEKLDLKDSDQLFLLGDYIDRGVDSKGVIDYIIELKQTRQIYPLRGNHEDDLLILFEFKNERLVERYIKKEQRQTLFKPDYQIEDKYINFIKGLPYFIELENVILVHAGFDFECGKPFENTDEMIWIRNFEYDEKQTKGKKIIHGHSPFTLDEIIENINNENNIIPIDNGCVFPEEDGYGNLLCLDIDSYKLVIQKNIEND